MYATMCNDAMVTRKKELLISHSDLTCDYILKLRSILAYGWSLIEGIGNNIKYCPAVWIAVLLIGYVDHALPLMPALEKASFHKHFQISGHL